MIRRPPRLTRSRSSAASDVYKRQVHVKTVKGKGYEPAEARPDAFHGTEPFHLGNGARKAAAVGTTFTEAFGQAPVSYTHLRAHETRHDLVCRLLLEKKKKT